MISNLDVPYSVDYLPTGDRALLMAWFSPPTMLFMGATITREGAHMASEFVKDTVKPKAILCLEDGTSVVADLSDIKFDFRYDNNHGQFVDVSGFGTVEEEDEGADTDQAATDHGGEGVPGYVPEPDLPSPGDPSDAGDGDLGGLAAGSQPSD